MIGEDHDSVMPGDRSPEPLMMSGVNLKIHFMLRFFQPESHPG